VRTSVAEVGTHCGGVAVDIENAPPDHSPLGPDWPGAGRGLASLEDRVGGCGGSLTVGPTPPADGWSGPISLA